MSVLLIVGPTTFGNQTWLWIITKVQNFILKIPNHCWNTCKNGRGLICGACWTANHVRVISKFDRYTDCACTAMQATAAESNQQFASLRISFLTVYIRQFYCQDLRPTAQHIWQQQHTTRYLTTARCCSLNWNMHLLITIPFQWPFARWKRKSPQFSYSICSGSEP